jgi:hypothetical protein
VSEGSSGSEANPSCSGLPPCFLPTTQASKTPPNILNPPRPPFLSGGGSLLMPIYQSMGQLSVAASVALSNATILAGSITNTAMNVLRRHPYLDRPLIDFDLFVLMQPSTSVGRCSSGCSFFIRGLALKRSAGRSAARAACGAAGFKSILMRTAHLSSFNSPPPDCPKPFPAPGAVIGSYVNKLLPGWMVNMLLVPLLGVLVWRTVRSALLLGAATLLRTLECAANPARTLKTHNRPAPPAHPRPYTLNRTQPHPTKTTDDQGIPAPQPRARRAPPPAPAGARRRRHRPPEGCRLGGAPHRADHLGRQGRAERRRRRL